MAQHIPYTLDYSGRQVDIELLQSITKPVELQRVTISSVNQTPKLVTGIQKLVQRYASLLLTSVGTVQFDQTAGTVFMPNVAHGLIQTRGRLQQVFASSNLAVIQQLRLDDEDTDTYGAVPEDEQIASARLLDFDIDFVASTIYLRILITTVAGSDIEFIVPTTAPR